jgi:hypothetical protein
VLLEEYGIGKLVIAKKDVVGLAIQFLLVKNRLLSLVKIYNLLIKIYV